MWNLLLVCNGIALTKPQIAINCILNIVSLSCTSLLLYQILIKQFIFFCSINSFNFPNYPNYFLSSPVKTIFIKTEKMFCDIATWLTFPSRRNILTTYAIIGLASSVHFSKKVHQYRSLEMPSYQKRWLNRIDNGNAIEYAF